MLCAAGPVGGKREGEGGEVRESLSVAENEVQYETEANGYHRMTDNSEYIHVPTTMHTAPAKECAM